MTSGDELLDRMVAAGPGRRFLPTILLVVIVLAGSAAFLVGILWTDPLRAWMAYLINFVFWTGLTFGAVLFSPMIVITNARWGRPLKRLAESFGAFLPASLVLFVLMYFGREELFPWVHESLPEQAPWLDIGFLFARDGAALLLLAGVAAALIYRSVRSDMEAISGRESESSGGRRKNPQYALSVAYAILYAFLLSLIAFDLIMSLSPHWHSTLFGAYYFVGSLYMGLAALMILAALAVKTMGMDGFIGSNQFYNLGKLLLGFCLMTGDFFFTQFLVIWYGNIPEETRYVIARVYMDPWKNLAWAILLVFFAIPFIVLLRRNIKRKPRAMLALSIFILGGMWLEKLLLIGPSLWEKGYMPLGFMEIMVTLGFFGIVALSILRFLQTFPVLPVSDPLLRKALESEE